MPKNRFGVELTKLKKGEWYTVLIRKNGKNRGFGFMPFDHADGKGIWFKFSGQLYSVAADDIVKLGPPPNKPTGPEAKTL